MKKVFLSAGIMLGLVLIIVAADFRRLPALTPERNPCRGYTIIEYDKGIDCNGDTIRLVRRNGFAERY